MRAARFDGRAFYAALDAHRQALQMSWRQVADTTGVSASTLTRMAHGKLPDVDGLAALCDWAKLETSSFILTDPDQPTTGQADGPSTLAMISTHLRADQHLTPRSAEALEEIIKVAYHQLRQAGPQ